MNTPNKTTKFFYKLCKLAYLTGAPNYWFEDLYLPQILKRLGDRYKKIFSFAIYLFVALEYGALFAQDKLSEKQSADLKLFLFAHSVFIAFDHCLVYYKDKVRSILYSLGVAFKGVYNDLEVEQEGVDKAKLLCTVYAGIVGSTLSLYGLDGFMQAVLADNAFITVISAWPHVESRTKLAGLGRLLFYLYWWVFMAHFFGVYAIVISVSVCTSYQYRNLQSYFLSLSHIFKETDLDGNAQDRRFEEAFKTGMKLHADTLRCTKEMQTACGAMFSGQIFINMTVLVLLMSQMASSERNLATTVTIAVTISGLLLSTGLLVWSAGDITIEAARLPMALFASGWHRCASPAASQRVRTLVVTAVAQAQVPVEIHCLGIFTVSYESYVSIVKSSYTVFSVLY